MRYQGLTVAIASFVVTAAITGFGVSLVYGAESESPAPGHPSMPTPPSVPEAVGLFSDAANSRGTNVAPDERVVRATMEYKQAPEALVARAVERAGASVKLAVGDRAVCFQVSVPSGAGSLGCAPAVSATDPDRPIIAVDTYGERFRVSGAMIDGVTDVIVHLADGSSVPVSLSANVFSVEVTGIPIELTYRKPDGSSGTTTLEH